jgi:hypothetical protein
MVLKWIWHIAISFALKKPRESARLVAPIIKCWWSPSLAHDFSKSSKNHQKRLSAMSQMRDRALRMCITNTTPNPSPKNLTSTHPPTLTFPIQSHGLDFLEYWVPKPFPFVFGNMGGMDMGWEQSQTGLNFVLTQKLEFWWFFRWKVWMIMFDDLFFSHFNFVLDNFISADSYGCLFIYSRIFWARKHSNLVQFYNIL